jgi:hypothetical protein
MARVLPRAAARDRARARARGERVHHRATVRRF